MSISRKSLTETESEISFQVPPFAERCLKAANEAWRSSFDHPFVVALMDGSLETDRFRFYQMQDARYLEAFADACSLISVRYEDPDTKMWFIEGARLAIVVERELHAEYGLRLGYGPEDIASLTLSPNNRAYQNHLIANAQTGTLLEAVAALSPCPWLYSDIGLFMEKQLGGIPENHPYADWLKTYADPEFVTYTNELLAHLQRLADRYTDPADHVRAVNAFVLSAQYEYLFWEQAWQKQEWST